MILMKLFPRSVSQVGPSEGFEEEDEDEDECNEESDEDDLESQDEEELENIVT